MTEHKFEPPCPECEVILDSITEHPNPEGLFEWYDAGNHVCGKSREKSKKIDTDSKEHEDDVRR